MGDCCSKPEVIDDYAGTLQKVPSRALGPDEVRVYEVQVSTHVTVTLAWMSDSGDSQALCTAAGA